MIEEDVVSLAMMAIESRSRDFGVMRDFFDAVPIAEIAVCNKNSVIIFLEVFISHFVLYCYMELYRKIIRP